MATMSVTRCDFCGAEKKESNHWWKLSVASGVLEMCSADLVLDAYSLSAWRDACGFQCVTQAVGRFLDHGNLEERI